MSHDFPQPGDSITLLLQARAGQASHDELKVYSEVGVHSFVMGTLGNSLASKDVRKGIKW